MCHIYVIESENSLHEMLSNPHEFVSEVGIIICFWRQKCRIHFPFNEVNVISTMHYNILVCGVLILMTSTIDSVILGPWIKCKLSLYRHGIKTSQILSLSTLTVPENLLLG